MSYTAYILADHGTEQADIGFEETVETEEQARSALEQLEAEVCAAIASGFLHAGDFVSYILDEDTKETVYQNSWDA